MCVQLVFQSAALGPCPSFPLLHFSPKPKILPGFVVTARNVTVSRRQNIPVLALQWAELKRPQTDRQTKYQGLLRLDTETLQAAVANLGSPDPQGSVTVCGGLPETAANKTAVDDHLAGRLLLYLNSSQRQKSTKTGSVAKRSEVKSSADRTLARLQLISYSCLCLHYIVYTTSLYGAGKSSFGKLSVVSLIKPMLRSSRKVFVFL